MTIGKLDTRTPETSTMPAGVQAHLVNATAETEPVSSPQFGRELITVQKTACRPDFHNDYWESERLTKDEILYWMKQTPFTDEQANIMAAIAMGESNEGLINCYGDDYKPYYMQKAPNGQTWYVSYGTTQIRTIVEQEGTGSCRDFRRLEKNIEEQAICSYEIWSQKRSFRPWTVYTSGKYKKYL